MIDARTSEIGPELSARVAIFGAGGAGLMLARRLASRMDGVLLVESGGMSLDGATQQLAAGRSIGVPYYDLLATRLRLYGGTTNHWTGFCGAPLAIDFEARPDIDVLPWSVDLPSVTPYLAEVAGVLEIDPNLWDYAGIIRARGGPADQMIERRSGHSGAIETHASQITTRLKMGEVLGPELRELAGLRQIMNLNAVEIVPGPRRQIGLVRAQTTTGKEVRIKADAFVLATHGIENARLLLDSTAESPNGVGNRTGQVGLYFADHPAMVFGTMVPGPGFPELYDQGMALDRNLSIRVALSEQAMRDAGVLNYSCRFVPRYSEEHRRSAFGRLASSFMQPANRAVLEDLRTVLADPAEAANETLLRLAPDMAEPIHYLLRHRFVPGPHARSRVVLAARRNAIGQRQADLDWQFADLDLKTLNVGMEAVVRELSALNFGRFATRPITRADLESLVGGTHHQMGTTRMAVRPEDGVVDFQGRVHEHDNLYVAGSSIFPSPGNGSPTMMLMALALRLGDHLLERYG